MIKKIKLMFLSFSAVFAFALPLAVAGVTYAANPSLNQGQINNNLCGGSNGLFEGQTDQTGCGDTATNRVDSLVSTVINIISVVVGIIAVIMIIIGGFRYVASGGKQESVQGAKNTILYAIIGLVIVALAQIVVHFVINKVNTPSTAT